jgi:tRNA threonylcarbamoyladenosine biosynthesis protein TsaE
VLHFTRTSDSPAQTRLIGESLGQLLRAGDVVLLEGALGAGKTTLVRAVAGGMGLPTGAVASPTFVLAHEYTRPGGASADQPDLIHIDAYRLHGPDDLESIGWDHLAQPGRPAAMIIEWAQRLGPEFLAGIHPARIDLEHTGEESREFAFEVPDDWAARAGFEGLRARGPTTCPITGQPVPADSPTYPFANEQARMADLYRWYSGSYSFSRDLSEEDLDEGNPGL